jgi:DNA-binding LacI/PurR family transcriptional regulator
LNIRRVTSQDVADLAGVSRTTVSLVLNKVETAKISPSTRDKVFDAADSLGYVPDAAAQALASRKAKNIGLIFTRRLNYISSDAFIPLILDGLIEVVHQNDMRLLLDIVEPDRQAEAYIEFVRGKRIDGILLSGPWFDKDALQVLWNEGFPTVLIGKLPGSMFYSVDIDNYAAAKEAVAYLVKSGHKRIVCITNASLSHPAASDRLSGYKTALEESGLSYNEELIRYGDFTVESGYQAMRSILEAGMRFTGAFVASDTVALGAKAALCEHGLRVPADVAIIGFDDLPIAKHLDPPLSTVRVPAINLARKACEILIHQLDGEHPSNRRLLLDTELIIRGSCGSNGKDKR